MKTIVLRDYQNEAVKDLIQKTENLLTNSTKKKLIVFKAPTGSGKTVMMAKYIEAMRNQSGEFCYLWLSIGKGNLHEQSRARLDGILEGIPSVKLLEDVILDGEIKSNQVVVMNWEKLNNKKGGEWQNIMMRDGEKTNFIQLLERTNKKRKVILIIDESHHSTDTATANELKDLINPEIMIEVSATPVTALDEDLMDENLQGKVRVKVKDVVRDGIIKKEVLINDNLDLVDKENKHKLEIAFEMAFKKRKSLQLAYEAQGSPINPLCLIQIPNSAEGEAVLDELYPLLNAKGVSVKNKNLAIWTNNQKENLNEINSTTSSVEFLIFKTAIATGWDCPRAQVLFKLRDVKSDIFDIQTIGRILRMPEQKHYANEELNRAYIYVNNENFKVSTDKEYTMVKHLRSKLKDSVANIDLQSYVLHSKRQNMFVMKRLKKIFNTVLQEHIGVSPHYTREKNLSILNEQSIEWDETMHSKLITNQKIDIHDLEKAKSKEADSLGTLAELVAHELDIHKLFEEKTMDKADFPYSKLAEIFKRTFIRVLGSQNEAGVVTRTQRLYLQNETKFIQIFEETAKRYLADVDKKKEEGTELHVSYQLPSELSFNHETHELLSDAKLYAHDKCFLSVQRSQPEKAFEAFIESHSDKVDWWMKNGDKGIGNFAVPYTYDSQKHAFYPDFIVHFRNGEIGIFETKSVGDMEGLTITREKAEALKLFIDTQNQKGQSLRGGIVRPKKNAMHGSNSFEINTNYKQNDDSEWEHLSF